MNMRLKIQSDGLKICAVAFCFIALVLFLLSMRSADHNSAQAAYTSADEAGVGSEELAAPSLRSVRATLIHDHDSLLTLNGRQIEEILRPPEIIRADLPTVIWQYRNDACVLDVYFTSSRKDVSAKPVMHYELRQRGSEEIEASICIRDFVKPSMSLAGLFDFSKLYKSQ